MLALVAALVGAAAAAHAAPSRASGDPAPISPEGPPVADRSPEPSCKTSRTEAVTRRSEHSVELSACWFDWLMTHGGWLHQVRTIPHHDDLGVPVGLKLYGIRRSSLLGFLGFRNADMLLSINDAPACDILFHLDLAYSVRDAVLRTGRADVVVQRDGRTIHLVFLRKAAS